MSFKGTVGALLVRVRSFPVTLSFYRDALGLPVNTTIHPAKGHEPRGNWGRFDPAVSGEFAAIELFQSEQQQERPALIPPPRDNSIVLAFKVDSMPDVYEQLKSRGVEFSKPVREEEWGGYAHFRDPEGGRVRIYESEPGSRR
jgi:catechol 2,3-dioxygenase-like lactoylglutathione lyase family enzyme